MRCFRRQKRPKNRDNPSVFARDFGPNPLRERKNVPSAAISAWSRPSSTRATQTSTPASPIFSPAGAISPSAARDFHSGRCVLHLGRSDFHSGRAVRHSGRSVHHLGRGAIQPGRCDFHSGREVLQRGRRRPAVGSPGTHEAALQRREAWRGNRRGARNAPRFSLDLRSRPIVIGSGSPGFSVNRLVFSLDQIPG